VTKFKTSLVDGVRPRRGDREPKSLFARKSKFTKTTGREAIASLENDNNVLGVFI